MHVRKKALLCVGLVSAMAALTGCAMGAKPVTTPTPMAAQRQTAEPEASSPSPSGVLGEEGAQAEGAPNAPMTLTIDGKEADVGAIREGEDLLLPLVKTAEMLGWKAGREDVGQDAQTKRMITLEKDDSRITVSWTVSDNTVKNVSWQKDGLLVPVDARLTTVDDAVYVPAAFFEEAMGVSIAQKQTNVMVSTPKPDDTPKMIRDSSGENG